MNIRIGVLCPSEIAYRRFMPALHKPFVFAGVAVPSKEEWSGKNYDDAIKTEYEKAEKFTENFGGGIYESYASLITDASVDAVYIPLPPSMHCEYAQKALLAKKHVLVEKPCAVNYADAKKLSVLAEKCGKVLHENYAFIYHSQIEYFRRIVKEETYGKVRLIRMDFGYPFRGERDFRYYKKLGGGALLDVGGYPIITALHILGDTAKLTAYQLNYDDEYDADIGGSATLVNDDGLTAQIGFSSSAEYRCSIDIWGSNGTVRSGRVYSAPDGLKPTVEIIEKGVSRTEMLNEDNSFYKSLDAFADKINGEKTCDYHNMLKHIALFDEILKDK